MVLECVKDVLLQEVAEGLKDLAILHHHMSPTPSNSSSSDTCWLLLERLVLLHCRSKDVLEEFSGYYCLRLLLDVRSPHATYFIDLFHELHWLLVQALITTSDSNQNLYQNLRNKVITLHRCISPAVNSCRYLFVVSEISKPADGITFQCHKYESANIPWEREGIHRSQLELFIDRVKKIWPGRATELRKAQKEIRRRQEEICMERDEIHMKRKAKDHRGLPMDSFQARLKFLAFGNLDKYSGANRVELGRNLGEGSFAVVYEGNFMTQNLRITQQRSIGQPVAVKVFRSGEISESEGCTIHTRELGSQFFKQMEAMAELKNSSHSTSSFTTAECNKATASHDFFHQTDELSEELWKLVTAKHPNIVSALGYIGRRAEGESGLVMELMSTSLQKYLEEVAEPVQEQTMVDIMLETAKGMRFLHECNIVHKDLKPPNILLRYGKQPMINGAGAMEVKLTDFGLAQRIVTKGNTRASETDTCEPAGTYCYMAPELLGYYSQFLPSSNNQDTMDVFSYGTTCFNILTCKDAGALGFTQAGSKKCSLPFYESVRSGDWRAWVKGKPEYLIDLIARCWAFDPRQRPTFAAICCLLQRAMLCILAPPVIDERVLVEARSRENSRDMLKIIMERSCTQYTFIGTSRMEGCRQNLINFTYISLNTKLGGSPRSSFLGELSDYANAFLEQWRCIKGNEINVTRSTEATIARGVMAPKPLAAPCKEKLGSSAESGSACGDLEAIVNADRYGSNTFTSKAVIRLRQAKGWAQIPLTTMDPQWNVCKAVVCCSIFSRFSSDSMHDPFVNWGALSCDRLELFPFEEDAAKMGLHVDESLMPFLECFWESDAYKREYSIF